jgi:hypothetical protein
LSPQTLSGAIAITFVAVAYVLIALAVRASDRRQKINRLGSLARYLDPVIITAGVDGKGSPAKLQILFFSCVVLGLLALIIMRSGVLSNLSGTILTLLGISAVGAAAAKATDVVKNRLESENWAWLIERKWLPKKGLAAVNTASWRDIVTTDGEFNVYRFQMLMFSILVGGSLLMSPWQDLPSFQIPNNLLIVLGLSQAVYISGKLAAPPAFADLDKILTEVRKREDEFRNAALTRTDPTPAAPADAAPRVPHDLDEARRRAGPQKFTAYKEKMLRASHVFESVTGHAINRDYLRDGFVYESLFGSSD